MAFEDWEKTYIGSEDSEYLSVYAKDAWIASRDTERERIINLIASWEAPIPNRRALCLAIRNGEEIQPKVSGPLAKAIRERKP